MLFIVLFISYSTLKDTKINDKTDSETIKIERDKRHN